MQSQHKKYIEELSKHRFVMIPLKGKIPFFKDWNTIIETPSRVEVFRNHNIGILTGAVSGITVLDIEARNDGLKIWKMISSVYPEIKTPMVKTPSGGIHIYFIYNKRLRSFSKFKLRGSTIGWDLLNDNRQVVAPPSVIQEKKYKWIISPNEASILKMPHWLENYLIDIKSFT